MQEDASFTFAPPLPLPAIAIGVLLALIPLAIGLRRAKTAPVRFLLVALALRVMFDAAPQYSIRPLVAGLTANALLSVATVGVGLLLIDRRFLGLRALLPLYLLILAVIISAALNGPDVATVQFIVKMAYFTILALMALQAFLEEGAEETTSLLVLAFLPALIFQLLAVATGTANQSPTDGSFSFVGGFNHESIYSLVLACLVLLLCFASDMPRLRRALLFAVTLACLLLANYRTVIIGLAPLMVVEGIAAITLNLPKRQRALPLLAGFTALVVAAGGILANPGERFEAAIVMLKDPAEQIRPPEQFTVEERRFASARSYVWSQYWYGFSESGPAERWFGHGADSWQTRFRVYAQNTFLSYLYEFGIFGAVAAAIFIISTALIALKAGGFMRGRLLAAHLGFFVIHLSTMPFWIVEGLIFYALLFALTLHYASPRADKDRRLTGA